MFKTQLNEKQTTQQLINTFCNTHDLVCDCDHQPFHILKLLATKLSTELTPQQKQEIIKCLGDTTTGEEITMVAEDDFGKDLEDLFAVDFGEDTG